jgi:hypothetical protein
VKPCESSTVHEVRPELVKSSPAPNIPIARHHVGVRGAGLQCLSLAEWLEDFSTIELF